MNSHYRFHATIHARPTAAYATRPVQLAELELPVCQLDSNQLLQPFGVTFEVARQRLLQLGQLDAEPDGYFVYSGGSGAERWQLDGHLYDRADALIYVELKGTCPRESLAMVLTAVDWPRQQLLFQLAREAVILEEPAFRRYAAARVGHDS